MGEQPREQEPGHRVFQADSLGETTVVNTPDDPDQPARPQAPADETGARENLHRVYTNDTAPGQPEPAPEKAGYRLSEDEYRLVTTALLDSYGNSFTRRLRSSRAGSPPAEREIGGILATPDSLKERILSRHPDLPSEMVSAALAKLEQQGLITPRQDNDPIWKIVSYGFLKSSPPK